MKYKMKSGYAGHYVAGGAYDRTGTFSAADDLEAFKIAVTSWLAADGKKPSQEQIDMLMEELQDDNGLPSSVEEWKSFIDDQQDEIYFTSLVNLTTGETLYQTDWEDEDGDWEDEDE